MAVRFLVALCLALSLLYVQVEGICAGDSSANPQQKEYVPEFYTRDHVPSLDNSLSKKQNAQQSGEGSETNSCSEFASSIDTAVQVCKSDDTHQNCFGSSTIGYKIIGSASTVTRSLFPAYCCCACSKIGACTAVHYNRLRSELTCVFHCGGTPRFESAAEKFSWIKPCNDPYSLLALSLCCF